tara:strand:- start:6305 stop:6454 length:150 start_codon:yes stop_codon:yes gene_type:complete
MNEKDFHKLVEKYEKKLADLIVMDDYDGGKAAAYREIIKDIKGLQWWTI